MPPTGPYRVIFDPAFREDLASWIGTDRKVALRAIALVEAILRDPYVGRGKPQPLKGLSGTWSRRLTQEHRVVYRVKDDRIYFLQARYQYGP